MTLTWKIQYFNYILGTCLVSTSTALCHWEMSRKGNGKELYEADWLDLLSLN